MDTAALWKWPLTRAPTARCLSLGHFHSRLQFLDLWVEGTGLSQKQQTPTPRGFRPGPEIAAVAPFEREQVPLSAAPSGRPRVTRRQLFLKNKEAKRKLCFEVCDLCPRWTSPVSRAWLSEALPGTTCEDTCRDCFKWHSPAPPKLCSQHPGICILASILRCLHSLKFESYTLDFPF